MPYTFYFFAGYEGFHYHKSTMDCFAYKFYAQNLCDKVGDVEVFINYDALVYSRTVGEVANLSDKVGDVEVFINYDALVYSRTAGEAANL